MLRPLIFLAAAFAAHLAHAGEAGKVIFVAGSAHIAARPAAVEGAVQEGEILKTGADGFIYIKTVDNGLFILRPNTEARITTYQVDKDNPSNTRVKLDLISGVARATSGEAVKKARQNFRFNTPVAAIGVRGTDFTVFTDQNETRVVVLTGGVVVSGFNGGCTPDGSGPCEGKASLELFAAQRGTLLQVQRGKASPKLLPSSALSPDVVSPARSDEPVAKTDTTGNTQLVLNLDAQKLSSLRNAVTQTSQPPAVNPPADPVIVPPVVVTPPVEALPSGIVWGRWQTVASTPATLNFMVEKAKAELVAVDGNYVLFRTAGASYVSPEKGGIAFKFNSGEAVLTTAKGPIQLAEIAAVYGGQLAVDFGSRTFATTLDVMGGGDKFTMRSTGAIGSDGMMYGDAASGAGTMNVKGLLSNDNGGSAAYIFNGRVDEKRTINGAASWRK